MSYTPFRFRRASLAVAVAMASGVLPTEQPQAAQTTAGTAGIEEIVVTARKREDNLQDVPLSIQAFGSTQIENLDIGQFEDFAVLSPSLSFISAGPGTQMMFIRGIADGSNPNRTHTATATMYLDEQPVTYAGGIADIHMYDIERIEILNGPQGTYYGAGSTSGTVRVITKKPNPAQFEAGVEATAGLIGEGDNLRTLEGFLNLPVADGRAAVRLVGWYDEATGFIDNVPTTRTYLNGVTISNERFAEEDYNREKTWGGRAALAVPFGERWQATLSGLYQSEESDGRWDHDPSRYDDLEVARFEPEHGDISYSQIALTVEGDAGIGDLVYAGAYFDRRRETTSDYSDYVQYASWGAWIQQFACDDFYWYGNVGCNNPSMLFDGDYESDRWSHELRLTSRGEGPLSWIAGAYYEKNESDNFIFWDMPGIQFQGAPGAYYISYYGGDPLPGEWWSADWTAEWEQLAGFGEVTYQLTEKLSATGGIRVFDSKFESNTAWSGYFYDSKSEPSRTDGSTDDQIYKLSMSYDVTPDVLTYFTYAEGFRPGGGNSAGATNPDVPEIYEPDVLESYEIGWKTRFAGNRVTFNGAAYYMEWKDFQTSIYDLLISPLIFRANAGDAEVTGFEAEVNALVTPNLTVAASATYNQAELAEDFASTVDSSIIWAEKGRQLPYVPEWKFMANVRYQWQQGGGVSGYVQTTYSYTDEMWNLLITEPFQAGATPQKQESYDLLDLRVGWEFADGKWGVEFFGSNVMDERAEIFINTGFYDSRITTNRPRTFGLRLKSRFE